MITIAHKGDFEKTTTFLKNIKTDKIMRRLEAYAQRGVNALASATPSDTGKTAASWGYTIERTSTTTTITWTNSNINQGVPIAVILQYGHGTGTGGYVKGIDYINPAIMPIMEEISDSVWKEVERA